MEAIGCPQASSEATKVHPECQVVHNFVLVSIVRRRSSLSSASSVETNRRVPLNVVRWRYRESLISAGFWFDSKYSILPD